jgi:hypothetical protein
MRQRVKVGRAGKEISRPMPGTPGDEGWVGRKPKFPGHCRVPKLVVIYASKGFEKVLCITSNTDILVCTNAQYVYIVKYINTYIFIPSTLYSEVYTQIHI